MAAVMGHHMVMVGRKSQIRLEKDIKRRICKVRQCKREDVSLHNLRGVTECC